MEFGIRVVAASVGCGWEIVVKLKCVRPSSSSSGFALRGRRGRRTPLRRSVRGRALPRRISGKLIIVGAPPSPCCGFDFLSERTNKAQRGSAIMGTSARTPIVPPTGAQNVNCATQQPCCRPFPERSGTRAAAPVGVIDPFTPGSPSWPQDHRSQATSSVRFASKTCPFSQAISLKCPFVIRGYAALP